MYRQIHKCNIKCNLNVYCGIVMMYYSYMLLLSGTVVAKIFQSVCLFWLLLSFQDACSLVIHKERDLMP